ncbi:M23 family metallopeptidase [Aciduricibacillus chroicocephali]|uniref:M23 family metallopeptidase n=1 Tax=Aciduricibacillus chroicocephali TaxID=3054939 RepID=A0ABY9KU03_9BACI|nr:M23 family metallopeptidase [Bacillaceae bacterium 44XB]
MREENNNTPKNKWSQMFKKKWFFPALYLAVAALLLTAVVWYQNADSQVPDAQNSKDASTNPHNEDAAPVMEQQEEIHMPVADEAQAEIVTKFYSYDADKKTQQDGIILFQNRYYQSTGTGISMPDGEPFDVVASLSGEVSEVKENPLLGNVVVMDHGNDITTYYASLGEVKVKEGDKLSQGELIGEAGKNLFMKDNGNHVHFELRKEKQQVNPEDFFNKPLSKLNEFEPAKAEEKAGDEGQKVKETKPEASKESSEEPAEEKSDETKLDEDVKQDEAK